MKKFLILLILSNYTFRTFAQRTVTDSALRTLTKIDIGFQGLGFSYEPRINSKVTVDLATGLGGGYSVSEDDVNYRWNYFKPSFYFMATPKFYYNRKRRIEKGKKLENNSGNYFGVRFKYATGNGLFSNTDRVRAAGLINVHWGVQRSLSEKWLLNAHAGLGYAFDIGSGNATILYPALDLKVAYLLN